MAQLESVGLGVRHPQLSGHLDLGFDVVGHLHETDYDRRAGLVRNVAPGVALEDDVRRVGAASRELPTDPALNNVRPSSISR